jgi:hypothetical protein
MKQGVERLPFQQFVDFECEMGLSALCVAVLHLMQDSHNMFICVHNQSLVLICRWMLSFHTSPFSFSTQSLTRLFEFTCHVKLIPYIYGTHSSTYQAGISRLHITHLTTIFRMPISVVVVHFRISKK